MASIRAESSKSGNKLQKDLIKKLGAQLFDLSPKDREATLSTLKKIFDNIIQHPNDDKYRQIKLTNKLFVSKVWRYPAAVNVMTMSGWEEDGDCVRLKDESHAEAMSKLLEEALIRMPKFHSPENAFANEYAIRDARSSTECCTFTQNKINYIGSAIFGGNGELLKELLRPYHFACLKNVRFFGLSITEFVCFSRQIGLARILAKEYGADFSSSNEGELHTFVIFKACDSTGSCQSLIIQFIKEFNMNVHKHCDHTPLHFAVLHKLFTIVKFLVEDCRVDVNCANSLINGGTSLHMAYGIGEESIAQYLIEHGANQDALDSGGRKPLDYKLYAYSKNDYSRASQWFIKERVLNKKLDSIEYGYYSRLCDQGYHELEATELTFEKFPSLHDNLDGGIPNHRNPTMKELNPYITDMAPSYYNIGLELDVVDSKLKVIQSDPSLPDLERKCRKMLEVWLETDISATWKKLCDALQDVGLIVLAEQIKGVQWINKEC